MAARDSLARMATWLGGSDRLDSSKDYGKTVILVELGWMCCMRFAMLCGSAAGVLFAETGLGGLTETDEQVEDVLVGGMRAIAQHGTLGCIWL